MIATYDGTPTGLMIADGTNPWVEVDGAPYDWTTNPLPLDPDGDPECACNLSPLAGTLDAVDDEYGIQRCDECQRFDGDLDAALALAHLVGGIVRFEAETD